MIEFTFKKMVNKHNMDIFFRDPDKLYYIYVERDKKTYKLLDQLADVYFNKIEKIYL
jgi:uncharacterized pyridoxamine 5'-phosphate oxidase family protein